MTNLLLALKAQTSPYMTVRARIPARHKPHRSKRIAEQVLDALCPEVLHDRPTFRVPDVVA